jgi:hypothetical protein
LRLSWPAAARFAGVRLRTNSQIAGPDARGVYCHAAPLLVAVPLKVSWYASNARASITAALTQPSLHDDPPRVGRTGFKISMAVRHRGRASPGPALLLTNSPAATNGLYRAVPFVSTILAVPLVVRVQNREAGVLKRKQPAPGHVYSPATGPLRRLRARVQVERPHEAIGIKWPAEVYTPSARPYQGLRDLCLPRPRRPRHHLRRPRHHLRRYLQYRKDQHLRGHAG